MISIAPKMSTMTRVNATGIGPGVDVFGTLDSSDFRQRAALHQTAAGNLSWQSHVVD